MTNPPADPQPQPADPPSPPGQDPQAPPSKTQLNLRNPKFSAILDPPLPQEKDPPSEDPVS